MTNIINRCKEKLLLGETVVGIWSIIPSAMVTEILASAGLDFIILDMEHGAFDTIAVADSIRAIPEQYCTPLVRVPKIDPQLIQRVLDMGAQGIVAPHIRTKEDVIDFVSTAILYPEGKRGFNPFTKCGEYLGKAQTRYYRNDFPLLIGIIENLEAYKNLDDILAVKGVDAWYLGVYDLSCAVGYPGQLDHPEVIEIMNDIKLRILRAGLKVGCMIDRCFSGQSREETFLVLKPDTYQLKSTIKQLLIDKKECHASC